MHKSTSSSRANQRKAMSTQMAPSIAIFQLVVACAAVGLPSLGHAQTASSEEAILKGAFSSIHLADIPSLTTAVDPYSRHAQRAAVGPIEKVDLVENRISVAGQNVDMTGLMIDRYKIGDFVSISGIVNEAGVLEAEIQLLPSTYVYGASLSYVEGFVKNADELIATVTVGAITIDYSAALSRSPELAIGIVERTYVRVVGIQSSTGLLIGADLQIVPTTTYDRDKTSSSTLRTSSIVGGDHSTKATLGGDRSVKAIIGGDRSAKAILGGDRTVKAITAGYGSATQPTHQAKEECELQ